MPKKHAPTYTQTKPSYVHPSLQSSRAPSSSSSATTGPQTVNQRIAQLRREQAPRATVEQRDELIAGAGTRTRRRAADGTRPPPGPAAPHSWLRRSRHAPSYTRNLKDSGDSPVRFCTLARVTQTELKRSPPSRSLQHECLKTLALHWEELVEFEQHYLPSLPTALKEAILSYLTLYAARGCLDYRSLKILFQNDIDSSVGWDEVCYLDFTELLNENFTLQDLGKCLRRPLPHFIDSIENLAIADSPSKSKGKAKDTTQIQVADSWEEEADEGPHTENIPSVQLRTPHFQNLSRLSLAHPGASASWADLLKISTYLNKLTHLSLAYWPRPTLTPNAVTTSVVSQYTSQSLSGTPFYSDLDDDWHEAANILRRFSINTYSLTWLDLEGCSWLKALTFRPSPSSHDQTVLPSLPSTSHESTWHITNPPAGPDWNDSWRRITYLHAFQGWIPAEQKSLQNMPAGIIPVQLMRWLRLHRDDEDVQWKLNAADAGMVVAEWVEKEKIARVVGAEIQALRRAGVGEYIRIDHGWGGEGA